MFQNNSSDWNQYPLECLENTIKHSMSVLMGEYLVIIVGSQDDQETTILAFHLRSNKVQEARLNRTLGGYDRVYTLNKYKENQIIKSEGFKSINRLSIKSFDRNILS